MTTGTTGESEHGTYYEQSSFDAACYEWVRPGKESVVYRQGYPAWVEDLDGHTVRFIWWQLNK